MYIVGKTANSLAASFGINQDLSSNPHLKKGTIITIVVIKIMWEHCVCLLQSHMQYVCLFSLAPLKAGG